jgi:multicomponent Na+:H+ antiporter subunit E
VTQRRATARGGRSRALRRTAPLVPILALFWLILSDHFEPLPLALGALSVVIVCGMSWRAEIYLHQDVTLRFVLRLPWFFVWLAGKVFLSALVVMRYVWSPRPMLQPVVAPTPAENLPELAQVAYANAITLTPGTLALDVDDDRILVHSLDPAGVDELRGGAMLNHVRRLGGRR